MISRFFGTLKIVQQFIFICGLLPPGMPQLDTLDCEQDQRQQGKCYAVVFDKKSDGNTA